MIIRLTEYGSIDATFGIVATSLTGSFASRTVRDVVKQSDGKYVISGLFEDINGVENYKIARLNTDGTHDATAFHGFDDSFNGESPYLYQQPNGKIIISGFTEFNRLYYNDHFTTHVVRTNIDGTIDYTMENKTKGFFPHGPQQVEQNINGKVLISSRSYNPYSFNNIPMGPLKQYNEDWSIDQDFEQTIVANLVHPSGEEHAIIKKMKVLDNGQIILSGVFRYTYQGTAWINFVILNPDGSVVYGWPVNQGFTVFDFDVEIATGKIIVLKSGSNGIIRILPTGELDTFNFIDQGYMAKKQIVSLPNGKIAYTSGNTLRLYVLNNDGTYVTNFPNIENCMNLNRAIDGDILISRNPQLQKISVEGSFDYEFMANVPSPVIFKFDVQPDGKILAIRSPNNIHEIYRLNIDGTVDENFTARVFADGTPLVPATLRFGKIFIIGDFNYYNGISEKGGVQLLGEDYYYLIGQNKFDNDSNGCSPTDIDYPFMKYEVANGSQINFHVANYTGSYSIAMTEGNYVVTPKIENPSYFTITPASVSLNFPTATSPQQQNFCIVPNGIHQDLEIVVLPLTIARPGFGAQYKIVYKNKGNVMVSGQVALSYLNNVMTFDSATPAATTTANQLTWNYADLWPFESREIVVSFTLSTPTANPPLNGGDIINLTAAVTPETTDEMPWDNSFVLNQTVVNSFDPNDKTCLEGDTVSQEYVGKYVHYMIRFENTGNGEAVNVTVKDNIDASKFDITSIVPLSGSHSFVTKIKDDTVSFLFENINLPFADATNDGFVMFKIKLIDTLEGGDIFTNQAEIYFDYNYPIATNTASTTIQNTMAVEDIKVTSIVIYPNPANDFVSILHSEQIIKVEIYSVDGRLVKSVLNPAENKLDISSLTKGQYIIKIDDGSGKLSAKLIKK